MSKIEKTIRELSDLRDFYVRLQRSRKTPAVAKETSRGPQADATPAVAGQKARADRPRTGSPTQ